MARPPHAPLSRAFARLLALLTLLLGCGSNKPELPAGISAPESCVALGYPDGPYGNEPGDVVKNECFQGWSAPLSVAHRADTLENIALSDFFDASGSRVRLLLLNTAAVWCSACRVEHESLPAHVRELAPKGLVVLSALFQSEDRNPAALSDLSAWVETFGTNFPMVLDPNYVFGLYASAETAPLNLLVDPRTMTIVQKYIGDQGDVMWPLIETTLASAQ